MNIVSFCIQETYGEDTYLSGELVTQYVRGLQGDHPRYVRASAGCKHFAVYAGPENIPSSRFSFDALVRSTDVTKSNAVVLFSLSKDYR